MIRYLNVNSSQASISVAKIRDANWVNFPYYLVVPGRVRGDGSGRGAQEGGSMIRIQTFSVFLYVKMDLDQYSLSSELLVNPGQGELDLFEGLRQLFAHTYLATEDCSTQLLSEPMWFSGEGVTQWEDQQTGLVSREFSWDAQYSVNLPAVTLFLPQVNVPPGP